MSYYTSVYCIVYKLTKAKYPMGINYVHCDHLSNHTLLTKLSEFNLISVKWIYYENRYFKNISVLNTNCKRILNIIAK